MPSTQPDPTGNPFPPQPLVPAETPNDLPQPDDLLHDACGNTANESETE